MKEFLEPIRKLNFIRYRYYFIGFSLLFIVLGFVLFFVKGGFKKTIDFSGGTRIEVKVDHQNADLESIRKVINSANINAQITHIGTPSERNFVISIGYSELSDDSTKSIINALSNAFENRVEILKEDTIGPKLSEEFFRNTLLLSLVVSLFLLLYIGIRFDFIFGLGAIAALIHDLGIMLSISLLLDIPMDITIISAILTILGYSLTDTVVVYDRIRENLEGAKASEIEQVVNESIRKVIVRSILTSFTTLLVVISIQIFGPETLKSFSFLLTLGIISGTYSSLFIASPIVINLEREKLSRQEKAL